MKNLILLLALFFNFTFLFAQNDKDAQSQVVGGRDAKINERPWQVALFTGGVNSSPENFSCGGSIIDSTWILTAAHCVVTNKANELLIVAGIDKRTNMSKGQVRRVSQVIVFPNYNPNASTGDIALLRLSDPLDLTTANAKAIQLLSPQDSAKGISEAGVIATTSGWGTTQYMGTSPDNLQTADIPIIDIETARQWVESLSLESPEITSDMLPVGLEEGGLSSCHGDSGGPLVVKDENNNYKLAGVVSWGFVCGAPKNPGFYSRVTNKYDWIKNNAKLYENTETPELGVAVVGLELSKSIAACNSDSLEIGSYVILNEAKTALKSFEVRFIVGNHQSAYKYDETRTVTLENELISGSSIALALPKIPNLEVGDYIYGVTVSKPNNGNDQTTSNNEIMQDFNIQQGYKLRIAGNVNFEHSEYSRIQIFDAESFSVVEALVLKKSDNITDVDYSVCLPSGKYIVYTDVIGDKGMKAFAEINEGEELEFASVTQNEYNFYVDVELPFVKKYDLELLPANKSFIDLSVYPVCDLNELTSFPIALNNTGTIRISNQKLKVVVNGEEQVIDLNMHLNPGRTITFDLNTSFKDGQNHFSSEVINLGEGISDENLANDDLNITFNISTLPNNATITLYNDESYWDDYINVYIQDTVLFKQIAMNSTEASMQELLCLPVNCYKLEAVDIMGDGIAANVAFKVVDKYDNELLSIKGTEWQNYATWDVCLPTSVEYNKNAKNVSLQPNPSFGQTILNFSSEFTGAGNLQITDILGNTLFSESIVIKEGENSLDLSTETLQSGMYFVNILSGKHSISTKLIINK